MAHRTNRRMPIGLDGLEGRALMHANALAVPTDPSSPAEFRGFNPQPDPPGPAMGASGTQDQPGGDATGFSWGE